MNVFVLFALAVSAAAPTTPAASPKIPAFVRFHGTPSLDDAAAGKLLLGELNCTACHTADAAFNEHLSPKRAPILSEVGDRVRPEWIRKLLTDPQQAKPGTTMPDVLVGLTGHEKARRVEALTHFLASTAKTALWDRYVDKGSIGRGEKAFHEVGCTACHGSRKGKEMDDPLPFLLTLRNPAAKYTAASLAAFLQDPTKVRPSGRMPSLNLLPEEARDIASYFLKDVVPPPNFTYELYDGRWDRLPDFSLFKPKKKGKVAGLDLSPGEGGKRFGMIFRGYFKLDKDSNLPFKLSSDDGSKLFIDDVLTIENDGIHPMQDREGKAVLKAGVHKLRIEYFNGGDGGELNAEFRYSGNEPWRNLASIVTLTPDGKPEGDAPFEVDPALAEEGRKLFASSGCASCHEMNVGKDRVASTLKAKKLTQLSPSKGCAANQPAAAGEAAVVPNFALSASQQKAIGAALAWAAESLVDGKPQPPTAAVKLKHTLATFNCYACHRRDGVGGIDMTPGLDLNDDGVPDVDPAAERLAGLFAGTIPEMGDEGRLPPKLDAVGAKMTDAWLKQTLQRGAKERPYMKTVMPKFGAGIDKLAAVFQELDHPQESATVEFDEPPYRVKADGRLLAGTKGFSCVKCHNFNKQKAEGIPGIDLTILAKRVRPEWFARYVRDPQQIRPGTRMPTVFPQGKSPLPEVLGGDVDRQIAALWNYLSDGEKAAVPIGVGGQPIELAAKNEPLMYRNFIADVGPRAIGVAYPEKANLAFDADNLRPALIWHGAFIDAARHWNGRGQGFQPPLGDDVVKLAPGVNFARLKNAEEPWPTKTAKELGYRFRGYRLETDRRPVFNYDLDGATVTDDMRPVKTAKQPGLLRVLNVYAPKASDDLWFLAASAKEIKPVGDGWFVVDGLWRVRVAAGGETPVVRSGPQGQELIVRVPHGGDARKIIEQEFSW